MEIHDFPWLLVTAARSLGLGEGDITQGVLARRLGFDQTTVSRWLSRERLPHRDNWEQIASGLEVDISEVGSAVAVTKRVSRPSRGDLVRRIEELERQLADCDR